MNNNQYLAFFNLKRAVSFILGLLCCLEVAQGASSRLEPIVPSAGNAHLVSQSLFDAVEASWVFSGLVNNESGDQYHYFFQIRHDAENFTGEAVLVNVQTNTLILHETSEVAVTRTDPLQWQVGRLFMRFNAINNSWIFGVKKQNDQGFNFKIDMLGQPDGLAKEQDLSAGLELLVGQTGHLNGHLQFDGQEEFVTANKTWFRQMWSSKPQKSPHPLTAVLCDFKDGAGFYALNLQGSDVLRGAVAVWRNEAGGSVPMSQFVSAHKSKEGGWQIRIPYPKLSFSLRDTLAQDENHPQIASGAIDGKTPGHCVITQSGLS